jgi:Domain of unknown function (DUF4333)
MNALRVVLTAALPLLLVAGCGSGKRTISRGTLDSTISKELAARVHEPAPRVDCPKDLDAKVGAAEACVLTDTRTRMRLPVAVRVKTVGDQRATYSIAVGKTPLK